MIGTVDVDGLLRRMPSQLFDEWKAYSQLDPFGTEATFIASSQIASAIFNTNRRKGGRVISPADLMPDFVERARKHFFGEGRRQSTQEQIAIVELLNAQLGGRDLRGTHGE